MPPGVHVRRGVRRTGSGGERINAAILAFVTDGGTDRKPTLTPESFAQNYIDSSASVWKDHASSRPESLTRTVGVLRNAAPVFRLEFYEGWDRRDPKLKGDGPVSI